MDYPNDVISLHRCADIIEGFFSLHPDYRNLILSKIVQNGVILNTRLEAIKLQYVAADRRDKIQAIKAVRDLYHNPLTHETMGLKEAKDLVESW